MKCSNMVTIWLRYIKFGYDLVTILYGYDLVTIWLRRPRCTANAVTKILALQGTDEILAPESPKPFMDTRANILPCIRPGKKLDAYVFLFLAHAYYKVRKRRNIRTKWSRWRGRNRKRMK